MGVLKYIMRGEDQWAARISALEKIFCPLLIQILLTEASFSSGLKFQRTKLTCKMWDD